MTRPAVRLIGALLGLAVGLVLVAGAGCGVCCLLAAMTLTAPLSPARVTAATITTAGLVLVAAAHGTHPQLLRRGLDRAGYIVLDLLAVVASGGRW